MESHIRSSYSGSLIPDVERSKAPHPATCSHHPAALLHEQTFANACSDADRVGYFYTPHAHHPGLSCLLSRKATARSPVAIAAVPDPEYASHPVAEGSLLVCDCHSLQCSPLKSLGFHSLQLLHRSSNRCYSFAIRSALAPVSQTVGTSLPRSRSGTCA